MRTLVIGDIHGGLRALEQVLERADVSPEDQLIFLGDYVDGWSHAVETVDFLLRLGTTHQCIFIKGNHDELCHDWLIHRKDNPLWRQHGGEATMKSYSAASSTTIERHKTFYEGLENYYLDDETRLFLHAGFTNLKGVEFEYFSKTFYWDRTLWELSLSLNPDLSKDNSWYPKRLTHYREIYIGHTPVTRIGKTTPQNAANVWNVDTGAAFKGPLSIIDSDTKKIWQSDPVHLLYPGETGRN
ncbi:serine/threonine protein phosphatase [Flavobacteriaceae bacterium TP-CH-4]|uniref:Serine/threonine protein phosphatase n=1 Tax=Pelagihabitans pacificus TaxID=2696054 RepID=A0A967ATD5_9FLAO|nr:metallophosphoesterase [Pelagihabitans pacificus]NHF58855.1 serine/threonine protein phosphatase [Pelagihabitans pacificus]